MLATNGFSRTEATKLTGVKPAQLSYLDEIGLIQPQKLGDKRRPIVLYSFPQILQLKTIGKLRDKVSLQAIRQAVEFLQSENIDFKDVHHQLIAFQNLVFLIDVNKSDLIIKQLSGITQGQIVMSVNLDELLSEVLESGKNINDFEIRIADYLPEKVA